MLFPRSPDESIELDTIPTMKREAGRFVPFLMSRPPLMEKGSVTMSVFLAPVVLPLSTLRMVKSSGLIVFKLNKAELPFRVVVRNIFLGHR